MEKIINKIIVIFISLLACSCQDFMEVHKEFVEGGEIMYAPKVDSMAVYSGKNRIKISSWIYNGKFLESLYVYWNNRRDSLLIPVSLNPGMDSIEFVIPDLKENSYTFELLTLDKHKVWSLPTSGFGSAYGNKFQEQLTGRSIKSAVINNGVGEISWNSPDERLFCTEVEYTTNNNDLTIKRSYQEDSQTICDDLDEKRGYRYRSLFLPELTAIDTFYTDWSQEIFFPTVIDRKNWDIIFATTEVANSYPAKAMIDGNLNTFWHSDWNVQPPFPYIVVIDMKQDVKVNMIDIYRRLGNTDSKSFRVYVSKNNMEWNLGGSYTFNGPSIICNLETPFQGRYLKLEFFESNKTDRSTSIAEVYAIGTLIK